MTGEWQYADPQWEPQWRANSFAYTEFVRARHRVWEKRMLNLPAPWTSDQIVATRKFTNVFRILDRGSQFLYGHLMQDTTFHTALFRAFLYRYTNRPEPWVAFEEDWGYAPTWDDALNGTLLTTWMGYRNTRDMAIFGQAYKMFSGLENKGTDRLTWAVNLARDYVTPSFAEEFEQLTEPWQRAKLLQTVPRCANFMSMQILTDMNYYTGGDENAFIIPGPGAIIGASLVSPVTKLGSATSTPADLIRTLTAYWSRCGDVNLYGQMPSLMDIQNTLCEFSKFSKWSPGPRQYQPVGEQMPPILPPHYEGLL